MLEAQGWYNMPGPETDVVLASRVRLARNLIGYSFPHLLSNEQEIEVRDAVIQAFENLLENFKVYYLEQINSLERKIMLERNIISQEFSVSPNKAVVLSEDEGVSAMINEQDHLRLACIQSGLCLEDVYQKVDRIDTMLEEYVHFAVSLKWGYLNTALHNTGTGLRASVMLHLPALVMQGNIGWALKAASQLGLQIKGYWGEGENSQGNMYQITNQTGIGLSEKEIVENVRNITDHLIDYERRARIELLKLRKIEIEDKFFRALGILRYCRLISSREAIELLAMLRFGLSLQLLDEPSLETVTSLLILSQKSHIQRILDIIDDETDNKLVDYTRAKLIRRALEGSNV